MLNRYPLVKKLFVQHNAVLPSSAPVEHLFSFAGMITRPHRRSLSDKTFEQLLLLKANEKKRSERRKHRAGCSKAEPKNFAPLQTPSWGPKFNHYTFTYRPSFVKIDTRNFVFRVIVVRDSQTHTNTQTNPQTGPITIHCAAKLSAQCND